MFENIGDCSLCQERELFCCAMIKLLEMKRSNKALSSTNEKILLSMLTLIICIPFSCLFYIMKYPVIKNKLFWQIITGNRLYNSIVSLGRNLYYDK